jgi:hypothetical protein
MNTQLGHILKQNKLIHILIECLEIRFNLASSVYEGAWRSGLPDSVLGIDVADLKALA